MNVNFQNFFLKIVIFGKFTENFPHNFLKIHDSFHEIQNILQFVEISGEFLQNFQKFLVKCSKSF